ncbi:endonuclease/exonuclease/phosphatase family protein [uncultured Roseobacter sp.]|uniref:endonuclease/exonuclease/phosphatase family protein n=1 Tax=uncultured Roseobacter sp. TaxID=114847 RepID=UPI0026088B56|nr:endonuclease/exonuclease/phosphatase family protein [uncultured Roseobacter sp.]
MLNAIFWLLALVVLLTTLLPLTNSVTWWVRMWDFPRVHILLAALVVLIGISPFVVSFKLPIVVLMCAAIFYQAVKIFPYTPLASTEVDLVATPASIRPVSMLSVNVLMENTRHSDLAKIIEREAPDVLLLMETDQVWSDALGDILDRYPTVKSHIADDHYGLIFATRLDPVSVDLIWPDADDTPALKAILRVPDGTEFNFIGLHPRPPVPGNDTAVRDNQIKKAALMTSSSDRPTVCMGDFNDVAWSWTTERFKRYGDFVEPRVGRGMYASFHAAYPLMRLPIDQIFITKDINLVSFDRLENFGSDHFPMVATVFFGNSESAKYGK